METTRLNISHSDSKTRSCLRQSSSFLFLEVLMRLSEYQNGVKTKTSAGGRSFNPTEQISSETSPLSVFAASVNKRKAKGKSVLYLWSLISCLFSCLLQCIGFVYYLRFANRFPPWCNGLLPKWCWPFWSRVPFAKMVARGTNAPVKVATRFSFLWFQILILCFNTLWFVRNSFASLSWQRIF